MSSAVAFAEHKPDHNGDIMPLRVLKDSLRVLMPYFDDPATQEIMINAPGDVWVERGGVMTKVPEGDRVTAAEIRVAARSLAAGNEKDLVKVLDCRMPGFRIAAAIPPIAINGPTLCIRKHSRKVYSLNDYLAAGAFGNDETDDPGRHAAGGEVSHEDLPCPVSDEEIAQGGDALMAFFQWMIKSYKSFLLAGSTGSGKTTFLNGLIDAMPHTDRILTIEDTAELKVTSPNKVMFESNDVYGVSIRSLVKLALRNRPDRIICGEVRGAEAWDFLDALNTGHSGGGASLHANSARDALYRLENLIRMSPEAAGVPLPALRYQIASTIHYVIFCSRRGRAVPGPRRVLRLDGIDATGNYRVTTLFGNSKLEAAP